jgi:hypothetical protein
MCREKVNFWSVKEILRDHLAAALFSVIDARSTVAI